MSKGSLGDEKGGRASFEVKRSSIDSDSKGLPCAIGVCIHCLRPYEALHI